MEPVISRANLTLVLGGDCKEGVITLLGWKGQLCDCIDPTFQSLSVDGMTFTDVDHDGFSQWIYLAFPEAFSAALRGTRYEKNKSLSFCFLSSCSLLDISSSNTRILRWKLGVNYLLSACSADGVRIEPRIYELDFYQA